MECCMLKDGKCEALKKTECEKCTFKTTAEERQEALKKVQIRLESLEPMKRQYILSKYYKKRSI